LVWIAGREINVRKDQPLPLVLFGPQCAVRKEMIRKLDQAGISWRIAAVSPSLAGLWASAAGGLGITARSRFGVPAHLTCDARLFDLPRLNNLAVTLHGPAGVSNPSLQHLRAMICQAVVDMMPKRKSGMRGAQLARQRPAAELI
jgi:DNA-binding transcriptional LysR family regulator